MMAMSDVVVTQTKEWGVLRRGDNGHIWWATIYKSEEEARQHATPLDTIAFRYVGEWQLGTPTEKP
jgi:hypothetical protein